MIFKERIIAIVFNETTKAATSWYFQGAGVIVAWCCTQGCSVNKEVWNAVAFPHQIKGRLHQIVRIKWTPANKNFHTRSSSFTVDFWLAVRVSAKRSRNAVPTQLHPWLHLTTEHIFENFGERQLSGCPLPGCGIFWKDLSASRRNKSCKCLGYCPKRSIKPCLSLLIFSRLTLIIHKPVNLYVDQFFLQWDISVIFAETFWSLTHFGHCLRVVLKCAATVLFSLYFQTFWPKNNFFRSFQEHFGLWPKKNPDVDTTTDSLLKLEHHAGFKELSRWIMKTCRSKYSFALSIHSKIKTKP